jgi:hypothetical protein
VAIANEPKLNSIVVGKICVVPSGKLITEYPLIRAALIFSEVSCLLSGSFLSTKIPEILQRYPMSGHDSTSFFLRERSAGGSA